VVNGQSNGGRSLPSCSLNVCFIAKQWHVFRSNNDVFFNTFTNLIVPAKCIPYNFQGTRSIHNLIIWCLPHKLKEMLRNITMKWWHQRSLRPSLTKIYCSTSRIGQTFWIPNNTMSKKHMILSRYSTHMLLHRNLPKKHNMVVDIYIKEYPNYFNIVSSHTQTKEC
jgi:hypothetical protein